MFVPFERLSFVDVKGQYHQVGGLHLKGRLYFKQALADLYGIADQTKRPLYSQLYDEDFEFAAVADACLQIHGIKPKWVSLDQLIQFLFPHKVASGETRNALLYDLNFPELPDGNSATIAQVIASVWSHTGDPEQALRLCGFKPSDLAWSDLIALLNACDPQDESEIPEAVVEEFAEVLARDLAGGIGSALGIASPRDTEKLLRQL
jgi:hypothetical protein